MKCVVNSKKSKTGKRTLYYATVEGKRISNINYARKWEAEDSFKKLVKLVGEAKIKEWATKKP